jgi:hypothetical protein
MPRNPSTGVYTPVVNSFSDPVLGDVIDPVDASAFFADETDALNDLPLALVDGTSTTPLTFEVGDDAPIAVRSGDDAEYTYISIGRENEEGVLGVAANVNDFIIGTAAGDVALRGDQKLWLGSNSGVTSKPGISISANGTVNFYGGGTYAATLNTSGQFMFGATAGDASTDSLAVISRNATALPLHDPAANVDEWWPLHIGIADGKNGGFGIDTFTGGFGVMDFRVSNLANGASGNARMTSGQFGGVIGMLGATNTSGPVTYSGGAAQVRWYADGDFTTTSNPGKIAIWTTPSGSTAVGGAREVAAFRETGMTELLKLTITSILTGGNLQANILSGNSVNYAALGLGRTANEMSVGVAGATNDFVTGTVAGDAVVKSATGALFLTGIGLAGVTPVSVRSGASGTYVALGLGRTANELSIGVAAATNNFVTGTAAGDAAVKAEASLFLASNGAGINRIAKLDTTGLLTLPGNVVIPGSSSGSATIAAPASGGGTVTLFAGSDTVVGKATTDELTNKTLNASVGKGTWTASGTWTLPALTLGGAITYGGVTLSNAVTGPGTMVLSAGPTLTGTISAAALTLSGVLNYGGVALSAAVTGTGNMVLSAGPTLTGTTTIATLALTTVGAHTISGAITYGGVTLSNAVTGNMVLSASPTITGHATIEGVTATGATGTGKFVFDTAPTLGVVTATSINFGGTALSNYTEGTWTPAITTDGTVGTPAYTVQVGSYERIGRTVTARFFIQLSGWTGSPTGNVSISGLPLANSAVAASNGSCVVTAYTVTGLAALNYGITGTITASSSQIDLKQNGSTGTTNITAAQAGTTALLVGIATYRV